VTAVDVIGNGKHGAIIADVRDLLGSWLYV
jgi:hypothetical protein